MNSALDCKTEFKLASSSNPWTTPSWGTSLTPCLNRRRRRVSSSSTRTTTVTTSMLLRLGCTAPSYKQKLGISRQSSLTIKRGTLVSWPSSTTCPGRPPSGSVLHTTKGLREFTFVLQAETDGSLWALDRQTFRKIVLKSAFQKRKMYESFLENVSLLECLEVFSLAAENIIKGSLY